MKDFLESGSKWNYRLNTPGSVTRDNWSLILPVSLERLLELEINDSIKTLVSDTGRITIINFRYRYLSSFNISGLSILYFSFCFLG